MTSRRTRQESGKRHEIKQEAIRRWREKLEHGKKCPAVSNSNTPPTTLAQDIRHLLYKILGICAVVYLIFLSLYGVFQNHDLSMQPAVREGDLVFYYRLDKDFVAGDSVVVEYKGEKQVRRVVAVGGDRVDVTKDGLIINGMQQTEPRAVGETRRYEDGVKFPVTLKKGQVFVLGDNREDTVDSRVYGPVDNKDVCGKVMTILRRKDI